MCRDASVTIAECTHALCGTSGLHILLIRVLLGLRGDVPRCRSGHKHCSAPSSPAPQLRYGRARFKAASLEILVLRQSSTSQPIPPHTHTLSITKHQSATSLESNPHPSSSACKRLPAAPFNQVQGGTAGPRPAVTTKQMEARDEMKRRRRSEERACWLSLPAGRAAKGRMMPRTAASSFPLSGGGVVRGETQTGAGNKRRGGRKATVAGRGMERGGEGTDGDSREKAVEKKKGGGPRVASSASSRERLLYPCEPEGCGFT